MTQGLMDESRSPVYLGSSEGPSNRSSTDSSRHNQVSFSSDYGLRFKIFQREDCSDEEVGSSRVIDVTRSTGDGSKGVLCISSFPVPGKGPR